MSGFSSLLDEVIRLRGLSCLELARRIGVHVTFVEKILHGRRPPPTGRLGAIADALDLRGEARERFIDAGMLARLDPEMAAWLERRGGRIPPLPSVADLGMVAGNPPAKRPMGRPRRRPAP